MSQCQSYKERRKELEKLYHEYEKLFRGVSFEETEETGTFSLPSEKMADIQEKGQELKEKIEKMMEDFQISYFENIFINREKGERMLQELYQDKALYDAEKDEFMQSKNKEGKDTDSSRRSTDQLLHALLLAVIGERKKARELYRKLLKDSALYDAEKGEFMWAKNKEGKNTGSDRFSTNQLLHALLLAVIGERKKARELYQKLLKDSALYDAEKGEFKICKNKEGKNTDTTSSCCSGDQLLHAIFLAVMGERGRARKLYQKLLKDSGLYDAEKGEFKMYKSEALSIRGFIRSSTDQLLHALLLAAIGKRKKAQELYQKLLKDSTLYDAEKDEFMRNKSKEGNKKEKNSESGRYSTDQLLRILAVISMENDGN